MAEILVGAAVAVLFEKLASADFIKLARSVGINSQLNKWKNTLSQIQAVISDAEQKQISERSVELWLHDLQDLVYDVDDLLDDLATETMRRKFKRERYNTHKVLKIIPTSFTPRNIMYGRKMSSKLDEITAKLHSLGEQKNTLGLNVNVKVEKSNRRLEETSLTGDAIIMGREGDKEALLAKLLENESCNQNISIVSIVGMGGIGKTTLAKVLYNEEDRVKDHFELKAWVCVSEEFDVFNISKAIFQAVDGKFLEFANLDLLHVALKEKLSNKRFLVVLDDVWNEDYREWELLKRPFVVGAPGSKIIVTTRKAKVALVMNSFQPYDLKVLSEDKALSLFARYALDEQNFDKHPTLKLLGEDFVKKCDNLPLALITLGRVLRMKGDDEDEWQKVLNSEIWNLEDGSHVLPALRLSYYDLPSHLKRLFAYCSLFPKDYIIDKNELVLLWMAQGFLNQSNGGTSKESLGREYFEELKSRSFFQTSTNDHSRYIMHDLINDLATKVAGEFFFRMDDKMDACNVHESFEKLRHISFVNKDYGAYRRFKELHKARGLRTFLPIKLNSWSGFDLSNNVLAELLPQLQFLRVLSLSDHSITKIPQSIGDLKHIRYLNFSKTWIERLPEQVSNLYNLQSLLLCGCTRLSSLPVSFVKLINLQHLDISDTRMLNKMPLGIGGLTGLQTLPKIIIDGGNGFKISELKDLSDIQGRISILGLEKVMSSIEAKDANLQQKKSIHDLVMEWSDKFDDSRNPTIEYEVLEGLIPPCRLQTLEILFYGGMKFPSWVGEPSFDRLTKLTLRGCRKCTHLPALGHLQSLKKLCVEGMEGVKTLGFELLGPTDSFHGIIAFPSLEVLEFSNMQGWERWSTRRGDNDGVSRSFPSLCNILIRDCPKLVEVSIDLIPSLRDLDIRSCSEEVLKSMVGVCSSIARLKMRNIKGLAQLSGEVLQLLGTIEYLCINSCNELIYLCESKSEACKFLVNLWKLEIVDCKNFVSLGEKGVNLGIKCMEFVREVDISNCQSFKSYNCPKSVERLHISYCSSMTLLTLSTTVHDLPSSSLKSLSVKLCDNLVELGISYCDNIESVSDRKGFGILPLEYLEISKCKNLKVFPHEHLESLTSLEELVIHSCPNIDNSFPCGLWPPNLRTLTIGCLKRPMSEWGVQSYPISLVGLSLLGKDSKVVSFTNARQVTSPSFFLTPSLTYLSIHDFTDVEVESVLDVLKHLPCLEKLFIFSCPKLKNLREANTTGSSSLDIRVIP